MSMRISQKSTVRLVTLKFMILPPFLAIMVEIVAMAPGLFSNVISTRPTRASGLSVVSPHETSSQRSGVSAKLSRVSQSMV